LVNTANENNYDFKIIKSVIEVNANQIKLFYKKIANHFGSLKGKHFALWGLAFKPNTDDVREAPSIMLIKLLKKAGATISAYDPEAKITTQAVIGDVITYAQTSYETLDKADALLIVTEWNEFRTPDFDIIKSKLKNPLIFDGRNLYDLDKMKTIGFTYYSIGRRVIK